MFHYSKQFAEDFGIPFTRDSNLFNLIADRSSTFEQLVADPENHLAQVYKGKRYRYTSEEMSSRWVMIEYQKTRIEKAWNKEGAR